MCAPPTIILILKYEEAINTVDTNIKRKRFKKVSFQD